MAVEMPLYKMDVKGVEAGTGAETEDSSCFSLLLPAVSALCCVLCLTLCNKGQPQNIEFAPFATSLGANLCSNCQNNTVHTTTSNNRTYNTVDSEILSAPSQPSSNELKNQEFSKDICRSMVAMLDKDHSGKLGFEEFKELWADIRNWKNVFRLYDRDNSGTLNGFELRQALNSAGYRLNNHVLNILMHRYGNKDGVLEFNDFIMCAVKLKTMIVKTGGITEEQLIQELQEDNENGDRYFQGERPW